MITLLERAQAEHDADISSAYYDGRVEGRVEGKFEEKCEIANNMLEEGESYEKIVKYTGLTIDDIKNLRKQL